MTRVLVLGFLLVLMGCQKEARFDGKPLSHWIQELDSPWYMARMRAANAIGRIGPEGKKAIPLLIKLLDDKHPLVRWAAAGSLGDFREDSRDALPALEELARNDPDERVRDAADTAADLIRRSLRRKEQGDNEG